MTLTHKGLAHFIGIGGIGMSGLARMYHSRGWDVQGSDAKPGEILYRLQEEGIKVMVGHDAAYVRHADVVIYSSSIPADHPERAAASAAEKKVIHRAEALAWICEGKTTLAVSGTHGKTTTTSLIGTVLQEARRDPSIVVGGLVISFGGNAAVGRGPEIVIEADESDSSFLKFSPKIIVITNVEEEHMEHFGSMKKVLEAYRGFLRRLPEDGTWVGCAEDPRVRQLALENIRPAILYGFGENDLSAFNIVECPANRRGISFQVRKASGVLGEVFLNILGRHNVLNALAAIAVSDKLGIDFKEISAALAKYAGAARRFDVKYEDDDVLIADDYAHHPTEIRATLAALKSLGRKRIFAVFQPHRYTRAKYFFSEFVRSFSDAGKLIVTDVYSAGEKLLPGVDGPALCDALRASGHPDVTYVERSRVVEWSKERLELGDLWIALGAGDIYRTSKEMSVALKKEIFQSLRGRVSLDEPLSRHTSLKVGGPAEYWIEPEDAEDLEAALGLCRAKGIRVSIFGAGSNLLPLDKGFRGAVVHLGAPYFKMIFREGEDMIRVRAGAQNSQFIQAAVEAGLGGCEFLMGIPGNIGGSLAMNAGSHDQSIDRLTESIVVLGFDGKKRTLKKNEISFGYRSSGLKEAVILEGIFRLPIQDRATTQGRLDSYRDHRLKTQDLQHPSAGCMFKNPKNGSVSSGRLIEEAGFKGRRIGGAQVSLKHANFIINLGSATAIDIERLIREVRDAVKQKFDVELETEVKILS